MSGKRIKFYSIRGKRKPKHPRVGSYTLTDGRTGMQINSDDAVKQWNNVWTHPDYYRIRNPRDFGPKIAEELSIGESGNTSGSTPVDTLQCLLRDSDGNVIGVYESTNQFTCELANASQVAMYQPTISAQAFSINRFTIADWISVGTVVASDPNGQDLRYRISVTSGLGDPDNGTETFIINEDTGEILVKTSSNITDDIDSMTITVEVRNDQNLSNSAIMTINVTESYSGFLESLSPDIYLKLSDTSGSTAVDSSVYVNSGTYRDSGTNPATSTLDDTKLAPDLDGKSAVWQSKDVTAPSTSDIVYVNASTESQLEAINTMSVVAWVDVAENSTNVNRAQGAIASIYSAGTDIKYSIGFNWLGGADSRLEIQLGDPNTADTVAWVGRSSSAVSTVQEVKMIAFTFNLGVVKVYVNGAEISFGTQSGTIPGTLRNVGGLVDFVVGNNATRSDPFFGNLQAVSQHTNVLSASEIAQLYTIGNTA